VERPDLDQFQEALQSTCGSLLEFQHDTPQFTRSTTKGPMPRTFATVRYIHLSVKEHFNAAEKLSPVQVKQECVPGWTEGHMKLAQTCLRSLATLSGQKRPSFETLAHYAISHWIDHLEAVAERPFGSDPVIWDSFNQSFTDLQTEISKLMRKPFSITSWIASFYLVNGKEGLVLPFRSLNRWIGWLEHYQSTHKSQLLADLSQTLINFSAELQRLDEVWGRKLQTSPEIIWDEVSAFMKSSFLYQLSQTKVTPLKPEALSVGNQSSQALCVISTTSTDGRMIFVLSIWPCKAYEDRWKSAQSEESLDKWKGVCSNWLARYKVWDVATKTSLGEICVPLD